MKKTIAAALAAAALAILAGAARADVLTTRMKIVKPDIGSSGWGVKTNNDWDIVDSSAACQFCSNTFTSTNTFTGNVFFSGGKVSIGTTTVSGSTLTVKGRIESLSGGFKFPDGSVQTSAATLSGTGTTARLAVWTGASSLTGIPAVNTNASLILPDVDGASETGFVYLQAAGWDTFFGTPEQNPFIKIGGANTNVTTTDPIVIQGGGFVDDQGFVIAGGDVHIFGGGGMETNGGSVVIRPGAGFGGGNIPGTVQFPDETGAESIVFSNSSSAGSAVTFFNADDNEVIDVSGDSSVGGTISLNDQDGSPHIQIQGGGGTGGVGFIHMDGEIQAGTKGAFGTSVGASTLTVGGIIESLSGGFKFPDGSVQTSAFNGVTFPLHAPDGNVEYSFTNATTSGLGYNGTNMLLRSGGVTRITFNDGFGSLDIGASTFLRPSSGGVGIGGIIFNGTNATLNGDGSGLYLSGDGTNADIKIDGTGNVTTWTKVGVATTTVSGSTLTVNGRIESLQGGYKFPDASVQTSAVPKVVVWSTSSYTTSTCANTSPGDQLMQTFTVPANTLSADGTNLRMHFFGEGKSAPNSGTFHVKLNGSDSFGDLECLDTTEEQDTFDLWVDVYRTGSSAEFGSMTVMCGSNSNFVIRGQQFTGSWAQSTSSPITVTFEGECSQSTNDVKLHQATIDAFAPQ